MGWSMCSPGMDGGTAGPICVFLSDRVELCLAGGCVSSLIISQGGGIYLMVTESLRKQLDKSGFPEKEKRGLGLSKRRYGSGVLKEEERTNFFFPSAFPSL